MARERGFSLLEMTMAMALMMVVVGSVFSVMNPAQGSFSTEPEVADMQQRLRVAQDTLYKDLVMAGAGAYLGGQTGSLIYFFAPVLPFRQGAIGDAPAGSFARAADGVLDTTDTITVIYVPSTTAQTTLARDVVGGGLLFEQPLVSPLLGDVGAEGEDEVSMFGSDMGEQDAEVTELHLVLGRNRVVEHIAPEPAVHARTDLEPGAAF